MIELKGVHKYYRNRGKGSGNGRIYALAGVSATFQENKITSVMGNSGSGKTTMAHIISGFEKQDSGEVLYDGSYQRGRLTVRNVFQDPYISLNPVKDVRWHLETAASLNNLETEIFWENLENTGLRKENMESRVVGSMSGGERQRLAFSMAISQQPEYLIMDEPFSYLDSLNMFRILQLIKELKDKITFIYFDHDMNRCTFLSDYIYIINGGRIEEEGEPERILSDPVSDFTESLLRSMPDIHRRI